MASRGACRALLAIVGLAVIALATSIAACSKSPPLEGAPAPAAKTASPQPSGSSTPAAAPALGQASGPSVDVLSARVGTMLRAWPASSGGPLSVLMDSSWGAPSDATGPYAFVFELRTPATLDELKVGLGQLSDRSAKALHLAVSSTDATSGFHDVGTYQLAQVDEDYRLPSSTTARWIKITVDPRSATPQLQDIHVLGKFDTKDAPATVAGLWRYYEGDPFPQMIRPKDAAGSLPAPPNVADLGKDDTILEIRQSGADLEGSICDQRGLNRALHGKQSGRTINLSTASGPISPAILNDEGTMLVAFGGQEDWLAMRLKGGGTCAALTGAEPHGTGTPVMLIFDTDPDRFAPYEHPDQFPGFKFVPTLVSAFDQTTLGGYQIAVISQVCNAASALNKTQAQALVDWVYSGGKLIILDADDCTNTNYGFLPYAFTTSNPGKNAAKGNKLVIVESNSLGSNTKSSPAFVDVQSYLADSGQQLGDANIVTTQDPHWCGHFYGTNVANQNGFEQMYAPFGQGLIIYDGFDADDNGIAAHDKITLLELKEAPDATLPCTQPVSEPFTLVPSGDGTFDLGAGKPVNIPLGIYASHGYSGNVAIQVIPPPGVPWPATVSDANMPMNGGAGNFTLNVGVPADAKAGSYPFVVKATDAKGNSAQTTVNVASSGAPAPAATPAPRAPSGPATPKIAPALAKDKRVAVYGIYFDFASATLKPESTPVLEEIAAALVANPDWNLTIEGHTDSVGTAAYNLDLSNRRAAAVREALVTRYHINGDRLSTAGYGFTRPKASNDTPEGRALNRRVELVRK
jgi:outer membrane protein OmpA-like peptidoglycan-associated protein